MWFDRYLPIALCLLFSTSSSFRFRADSVSDLELLADEASSFILVDFLDSSVRLLELMVVDCTCTDPSMVLLVRLLHWEPLWSRSVSESSRLWLISELESWTARLSAVLLLGVGELVLSSATHTGGGSAAG